MVPGRKFSTTTSAVAHSSSARCWQSSVRRFSATERLLRAITDHHSEWPLCLCWPHSRSASPFGGASTLMTSAPKSASRVPTYGPAMSWPNSTTRRPVTGPPARDLSSVTRHPLPRGERGPTRRDRRVGGCRADLRRTAGDERREDDRRGRAAGVERRAGEYEPPGVAQLLDAAGGAGVRRVEAQAMGTLDRHGHRPKLARERRQGGARRGPPARAHPRPPRRGAAARARPPRRPSAPPDA